MTVNVILVFNFVQFNKNLVFISYFSSDNETLKNKFFNEKLIYFQPPEK